MIIAIDGPAGAGKSTVARRVAERLGLRFLDTGAMYRAVTLCVLERGVHPADEEACAGVARELQLDFDDQGRVMIDGQPREPDIRSSTVTLNVSAVSAHRKVREAIVARQQAIGRRPPGIVAEGRDTTTVVFPEADHKFFLNASVEERARRRALQDAPPGEAGDGPPSATELAAVRADIERRDRLDTTRANSPLVRAKDAIEIDADQRSVDAVVDEILRHVRGRKAAL